MARRVLAAWEDRPPEVAYLLNPAFCVLVIRECVRGYQMDDREGMPVPVAFLALPIVLYKRTREALPTIRTRMHAWIANRPELRIGFGVRARSLVPYTRESMLFGVQHEMLTLDAAARLQTGRKRFPKFAPPEGSEAGDCLEKALVVGRLLARTGNISTTYAMWGIKP